MTTYRHYSATTVHVLRDGVRIGSLRHGRTGSWFFEHHTGRVRLSHAECDSILSTCLALHGKFASPELVAKLNP
jgi:hypothetical protein